MSEKSTGNEELMKLVNAIIQELNKGTENAVLVEFLDSGDVGNLVGYAIAQHLSKDEIQSFVHGLEHGISLITGSHDSMEVEHITLRMDVDSPEKRQRASERLKLLNFGE